ncbi:MAG: hypothetical protein EWM47_00730 [Anaerolineaceae bacterium]|nr:MAG: hypothetical protein EWM47_00730 [Anaerolineaceae bacterium]
MEQRNKYVAEVNLKELIFELVHKLWIIILVGIVAAGVSWVTSYFLITPIYTSSTSVYIINRQSNEKMTLADLQTGTQLTKDYMFIVKSRPVTEQVIYSLNLDMTNQQLADLITVNTPQDTRILEITVKHTDPQMAKLIADFVAKISAERMVGVMNMESVNIVEEGSLPTIPSTPNVILNTVLASLVGVVSAAFAVILVYYFNDFIRTSDDIERYLNISTLGIIPVEESKGNKKVKKEIKKSLDEAAITDWEWEDTDIYEEKG